MSSVALSRAAGAVALVLGLLHPGRATADEAAFGACVARLQQQAIAAGVPAAAAREHLAGVERDPSVLEALDQQPEFRTPIWDYLAALVDIERIEDGRAMLGRWRHVLAGIETRYGIDPATVVAVWGVESDYGRLLGRRNVVRSLATLSCEGRRQTFFRGELMAALKILAAGHVEPDRFTGSWAGAFGQTQFMPTTFLGTAVDFDGDGRRDIIDTVPDALASTANFLVRAGWRRGQPWGFEVTLPAGFDATLIGRAVRRPLGQWQRLGVKRADGGALDLPEDASAALLRPAGRTGPTFMVLRNYEAIRSYNAADSYALAIAHLSDRLRGGAPFVTAWPTDDPGLSRIERRELQTLLGARGHAIGQPDGQVGPLTRRAIRAEQVRLGLPEDGRAGQRILDALRREAGSAAASPTR